MNYNDDYNEEMLREEEEIMNLPASDLADCDLTIDDLLDDLQNEAYRD